MISFETAMKKVSILKKSLAVVMVIQGTPFLAAYKSMYLAKTSK